MEGESSKGGGGASTLSTGNASDFVKKLYRMLSEKQHSHVVRWADNGGSFIVFDNSEFTKNVLPQHFKHSNFASFVRQLNKYDFHKVRATDESLAQNGDQAWEFVHPQFRFGNDGNLDVIKRKAPSQRNKKDSEEPPKEDETREIIAKLEARLDQVCAQVATLQDLYHKALSQVRFLNNTGYIPTALHPHHPEHDMPIHVSPQMMTHPMPPHGPPPLHHPATPLQQAERFRQQQQHSPIPPPPHHPNGYLDMNGNNMNGTSNPAVNLSGFGNTASQSGISLHATDPQVSTTFRQETRRAQGARKKSAQVIVPHWKRPPKILLVEDDPTCRKIGLKFLEAVGCLPFYACDGLDAVSRFRDPNGHRYDLILMDIIMPQLDGTAACGLIRSEKPDMRDPPIIAMTSNIRTTDINLYFNSGMIDVLPKPFTRDGLFQILQKWLGHLQDDASPTAPPPTAPGAPRADGFPNNTSPQSNAAAASAPQQLPITSSTSPVLKVEYENTTNSHADDRDDELDDDAEINGRNGQDTPDSSVGGIGPASTLSGGGISHPHVGHPPHPNHGHHPSGDYTFGEPNGPPPRYVNSASTGGVEGDMLSASAGIYAPGLGNLGGPPAGMTSPRGGIRRQMDAGIHDEYDPRMKRMRFNAA